MFPWIKPGLFEKPVETSVDERVLVALDPHQDATERQVLALTEEFCPRQNTFFGNLLLD
jgi:hypothetical protein